jgi:Zn-finger nucleic acid-binding protein
MTGGGPFRERPRFLSCPRCGEILDRGLEGIRTCLRCEGVWLPQATLTAAFEDPKWPGGQALWWRNSIECPECATAGEKKMLEARMARGVMVDRCHDHGVWLDRSELGRLMGAKADELVELQRRLEIPQHEIEALAKRRAKWRTDLAARREASSEYEEWLDEVERQRADAVKHAAAAAARTKRERDEAAAKAEKERARAAKYAVEEAARQATQRDRAKQDLGNRLASASEEHAKLEQRLATHREATAQLEKRLFDHRAVGVKLEAELGEHREWVGKLTAQLEAAIANVRALHDELALLDNQPV